MTKKSNFSKVSGVEKKKPEKETKALIKPHPDELSINVKQSFKQDLIPKALRGASDLLDSDSEIIRQKQVIDTLDRVGLRVKEDKSTQIEVNIDLGKVFSNIGDALDDGKKQTISVDIDGLENEE